MPSIIRLCPRPFTSLPCHPAFDGEDNTVIRDSNETTQSRPDLRTFLHSALSEAQTFLVTTIPRNFKVNGRARWSPPSTAKVQLLTHTIRAEDQELDYPGRRQDEFWVCRRSVHLDAPVEGTASWNEFRRGLRENHSENEMEYTPSLTGVERLMEWPIQDEIEGGWREVDMHVNMLTHTVQPQALVSPRSFVSLIISALSPPSSPNTAESNSWVTIQIPLAHDPVDSIPESIRSRIASSVPKNTIFASYASIERLVHLSPPRRGSSGSGGGTGDLTVSRTQSQSRSKVEWTLATTSDAGGSVPQWVQRSWYFGGVPKAVVKDVGLFIGWTVQRRSSNPP